jgi:phosphatidylglycerophosphate synthase
VKLANLPAIVQENAVRHECIILADNPDALVELCGISLLERLLRILQRCELKRAIILSATPDIFAQRLAHASSPHREKVALEIRSRPSGLVTLQQIVDLWPNGESHVLVISAGIVFDSRLLQLLDDQNATCALLDSETPENLRALVASAPESSRGRLCGAALLTLEWSSAHAGPLDQALREDIEAGNVDVLDVATTSRYLPSIRRELRPYWFPAPVPRQRKTVERILLGVTQKGALDLPALVHGPIEDFLLSHLWKTSITPNQLTLSCNIVAWGATFLFATGYLGWGAILALVVGILDGLDGKLARVKVETTKTGKLEHWFDALFENSWWIALAYHLQKTGQLLGAFRYLLLLMSAEAAAGLAKWGVIRISGRSIYELGNFDRLVRLIGGRRNVYIWLFSLGLLFGSPAQAFKVIAWWGVVTAAVQVPRALTELWLRREV